MSEVVSSGGKLGDIKSPNGSDSVGYDSEGSQGSPRFDQVLSVSSDSTFEGSYGGLSVSDLNSLLSEGIDNRKYRSIELKDYFGADRPSLSIAEMFDKHFEESALNETIIGDKSSGDYRKVISGLRGSDKHLSQVIDRENKLKDVLDSYDGQFSFLTLTCNFNDVGSVSDQIDLLREARNDLNNFMRSDFNNLQYFWVWELHKKSGFVHLHQVVLGHIPEGWLNGSGIFNGGRKKRGSDSLNDYLQDNYFPIKNNSLDWEFIRNDKGKNRAGNYLSNYMTKQQSYSTDSFNGSDSDNSKVLSKVERAYFLGLTYLKNLRLFGSSSQFSKVSKVDFDNLKGFLPLRLGGLLKGCVKSKGDWIYIDSNSSICEEMIFKSDDPPPPEEMRDIAKDYRWAQSLSIDDLQNPFLFN